MSNKRKNGKEEKEGKEKDSKKLFFLLGRKSEPSTLLNKDRNELPITKNKCQLCKNKNNLVQCMKCFNCFCIDCIKKKNHYKNDIFMENGYICENCNKRESPESKKQNNDKFVCFICKTTIKGNNMHNYLVTEKQKQFFKNKSFNNCILLDEKDENIKKEENELSIISICNKCYLNHSELVDIILKESIQNTFQKNEKENNSNKKLNEDLNKNIFNILNYCTDDKNDENQEVKNIEIQSQDLKLDLNNKIRDNNKKKAKEKKLNNKEIDKEDYIQQLLEINSLKNPNDSNTNDINNNNEFEELLKLYLNPLNRKKNNSNSNKNNFLNLNNLKNLFEDINVENNFPNNLNKNESLYPSLNIDKNIENQFSNINISPNSSEDNNLGNIFCNYDFLLNNYMNNFNDIEKKINNLNYNDNNLKKQSNNKEENKNLYEKPNSKEKEKKENNNNENDPFIMYYSLYKTKESLSQIAQYLNKFEDNNIESNFSILSNIDILAGIFSTLINKMKNANKNNLKNKNNKNENNIKINDNDSNSINDTNNINRNDNKSENIELNDNIYEYYLNDILLINDSFKNKFEAIKLYSNIKNLFLSVVFKNIEIFILKMSLIKGKREIIEQSQQSKKQSSNWSQTQNNSNINDYNQFFNNNPLNMSILNNIFEQRNKFSPSKMPIFNQPNNNYHYPSSYFSGLPPLMQYNNINNNLPIYNIPEPEPKLKFDGNINNFLNSINPQTNLNQKPDGLKINPIFYPNI